MLVAKSKRKNALYRTTIIAKFGSLLKRNKIKFNNRRIRTFIQFQFLNIKSEAFICLAFCFIFNYFNGFYYLNKLDTTEITMSRIAP